MAKFKEKLEARELRKQGESIKVIAKKLKVSPSSVSFWCQDIKLSPAQIKELERRARDPHIRRLEYALTQQGKGLRNEAFERRRDKEVGALSKKLFLAGVILYWTEGLKRYPSRIR